MYEGCFTFLALILLIIAVFVVGRQRSIDDIKTDQNYAYSLYLEAKSFNEYQKLRTDRGLLPKN